MDAWPDIPFQPWRETCAALQLYAQIVGKYRLAQTPWLNHSWHASFYVNGRGLTSSLIPDRPGAIEVRFDLLDHAVVAVASDGGEGRFELGPMSVADFHGRFLDLIRSVGGTPRLYGRPNELPDPVLPFTRDVDPRPYDKGAVTRFFAALVSIDLVLEQFRTSFLGKSSPVHLFWGSFDLAVTRFSGRRAPLHPGGIPNLPDDVTREAYSHEVSSAGFWPGGGPIDYPAFYSYAYPEPAGFAEASITPAEAAYHTGLGEYVLPYDAVRRAPDPTAALTGFLESTYSAAAELGGWDRRELECLPGRPLVVRPL